MSTTAAAPTVLAEVWRIARFGVVGVAATLTHLACAEAILLLHTPAALSFLLGFLPAFAVSYLGHRYFTFGAGSSGSLLKFLVVALIGLAVGEAALHALAATGQLGAPLRILISVFLMPFATYFAAKFWAFR